MIICLIVGLIRKTLSNEILLNSFSLYKKSQCFPKLYGRFDRDISVKYDLPNCVTKADLKGATGVDTSNLAIKSSLAKLKTEVDKIDIDKFKTVSVDLIKLSNVVNHEVIKKTVYDKLVAKK